jgi:hypothetical protein
MKKLYPLVLACILAACQSIMQEKPWVFVSMPDFLNVDCDYPEPKWEDALTYILEAVKAENPDFLTVAGDVVMGHWDAAEWNDRDTIAKYAKRYYTAWINRMDVHGLRYYVSIGDHEIGDNPWRQPKKLEAVKYYKRAFSDYFQMPRNGPAGMKGTAFWWKHKNTLFVSVDVFETGESNQGFIKAGVSGEQLAWLEEVFVLNKDVNHRIVLGHTPVLGPVRKWSSSGLMIKEGQGSGFWQLMKRYNVDAYLCGEVHAVTCTERDGIIQVAHGGLIGYNTRTNYLVCKVYNNHIEMEIKEIGMQPSGDHKWQTKRNRPLENVTITGENKAAGFYKIGTLTIDKSTRKVFSNRKGYFKTAYESSDLSAVPIFRKENTQGLPVEPPKITIED